jgi:hypothetical protein
MKSRKYDFFSKKCVFFRYNRLLVTIKVSREELKERSEWKLRLLIPITFRF